MERDLLLPCPSLHPVNFFAVLIEFIALQL